MICPHCHTEFVQEATPADLANQVTMSIRVYWETKDWTPAQFRKALVAARLR